MPKCGSVKFVRPPAAFSVDFYALEAAKIALAVIELACRFRPMAVAATRNLALWHLKSHRFVGLSIIGFWALSLENKRKA